MKASATRTPLSGLSSCIVFLVWLFSMRETAGVQVQTPSGAGGGVSSSVLRVWTSLPLSRNTDTRIGSLRASAFCFTGTAGRRRVLKLRGGGLFKKLKKGMPLDFGEKEFIEKAKKRGVRKAAEGTKSRRELASLHRRRKPPALSGSQSSRIANRIAEKAHNEIGRLGTHAADIPVSVYKRPRGGSRRLPRLKDEAAESRSRKMRMEWMDQDAGRMITEEGGTEVPSEMPSAKNTPSRGWKFDAAMLRKAEGEKEYLSKLRMNERL